MSLCAKAHAISSKTMKRSLPSSDKGETPMSLRETWSAYEGAWSEADTKKRARILRQTLDAKFIYSDPLMRTEGHDELSGYIGELQKTVPGVRIVTSSFEQHHDACLVKWTMQDGHDKALAHG